ncbi:hypothetical protein Ciccas_011371, partial [Cichlidogyrus casuarinus]
MRQKLFLVLCSLILASSIDVNENIRYFYCSQSPKGGNLVCSWVIPKSKDLNIVQYVVEITDFLGYYTQIRIPIDEVNRINPHFEVKESGGWNLKEGKTYTVSVRYVTGFPCQGCEGRKFYTGVTFGQITCINTTKPDQHTTKPAKSTTRPGQYTTEPGKESKPSKVSCHRGDKAKVCIH